MHKTFCGGPINFDGDYIQVCGNGLPPACLVPTVALYYYRLLCVSMALCTPARSHWLISLPNDAGSEDATLDKIAAATVNKVKGCLGTWLWGLQ